MRDAIGKNASQGTVLINLGLDQLGCDARDDVSKLVPGVLRCKGLVGGVIDRLKRFAVDL